MASSATLPPEYNQWSPADAAAQGIAEEYTSQWHILEQLKSSVPAVDPLADTSKSSKESVDPGSTSNQETTANIEEAETEETKKAEKEWFILPDAPCSGHTSDAGSDVDSALEVSDLRNDPSYSHSSNRTTPSSSTKTKEVGMEKKNENDPYQEQWHVLEELKASVKAMQWSSNASDSSLDVSRQTTPPRNNAKKDDFTEPPKRSPVANSNLVSGSASSFGNTDDEGSFRSGVSLKAAVSHTNNLVANTSLPVHLTQTSLHNDHQPRSAPSSLYQGTALPSNDHPALNTSSDLSLESENLGFADLPNRPATIGNYGASDAVNTSPFGITGIPLQPINLQVSTSQNIISVPPSTFSGNGGDVGLMSEGSETLLSKAPMSARERLQPDGRDGPDVLAAPTAVQGVPSLISYPLSAGSSSDNAQSTGPQPSMGNSDLDSSTSSNLSQVGQLLVGDATQNSPYSSSQISASAPMTSGTLGMSIHSNNSVGLPPGNIMGDSSPLIGSQLTSGIGAEDANQLGPRSSANSSLQSNLSREQNKVPQSQPLPWHHGTSLTDQSYTSYSATPVANTSWLSSGVSPTSQALIDLPAGPSNQAMGSFAKNEIRDAVMQRIEAHTQLSDFGSKESPKLPMESSFSWPKPADDSGIYGTDGRFVGNGQVAPSSAIPARSYHSFPDATQGFLPTTTQAATTSPGSSLPGTYSYHSLPSALPGKSSGEVYGTAGTYSSAQDISRSSLVEDPQRPLNVFPGPSVLEHVRSGLLNSENDEQSPVSKLLGPKFKATQDYLNQLKTERLRDSSFKSSSSSASESRAPLGSHGEDPFDSRLRQREYSKEVSPKFSTSYISDNSYERKFESKQAWSVETSDVSEPLNDSLRKNKEQSLQRQHHSLEHKATVQSKDVSGSSYTRDVRSTSLSPYDRNTPSTASTDRKSTQDSYLRYSRLGSFPTSKNEGAVHGMSEGLSQYETPLSGLQPDEKAWAQDIGRNAVNKRTLYSTESNSLLSSHDEAEDTDDLLSYEAVLEGDIKYIRRLKDGKQKSKQEEMTSNGHFHSSSINSKASLTSDSTPKQLMGDLSSINGSTERDPLTRIPVSVGSSGSDFPSIEEETKRFHISLGAGLVSPVLVSENENYQRTPEESTDAGAHGDDDEAQLSSDGIEIEDIEEEQETFHPNERESPTTESSSSGTYQPYIPIALRQQPPASTERDSEITTNSSSTYGVYDIRHSSGPGSTNRRRKAMGLTPIPGRVSKPMNGVVYVSPESSPMQSSMQEEDASTDEKSSKDDTLTSQPRSRPKSDHHDKHSSHRYSSQEGRQTGSRERSSSRHSAEDRESRKKKSSRDKDDSSRSRSRASSFEEAKVIDDYIGGRKLVQRGKTAKAKTRTKDDTHSDEGPSIKEYSTSTAKNADLNHMWERFQESLKSSPRYTRPDSVSSHLSRLSALLSKPLETAVTSSETEFDGDRFRKPRSHSYASSSSEVSTESEQLYNENAKSSSLSRQIKLRRLLETVNVADVPIFPRLRHRDTTTTTTTATSSTFSDTSFSEAPEIRSALHATLPRSNRGLRKVSKTPVLVPSSQTRRTVDNETSRPKCICAIHKEKPVEPVRVSPVVNDKQHVHRPRTLDAAVNVPSPKTSRRVRKKEGLVDVGVQTMKDSDDELYARVKDKSRRHHKEENTSKRVEASTPKRKERHIASQNSPVQKHDRYVHTVPGSPEESQNTIQDDTRPESTSRKEKSRSRQRKDRLLASQNSSVVQSNSESPHSPSGPSWFYPMTNRHYSYPSRSTVVNKHSKSSLQTSVVKPDRLRFDENTAKAFSPPAAAPSMSMQKLSLQEAFCFAKPDFIKRSRARLTRIEHNRVVRETGETRTKGDERVSKMEIPAAAKPSVSKPTVNNKTEKHHRPKPRQMSRKEIKEMNLRLYNNLPEVKAQKAEDRRAAFYKTNRLRAKLYDKRVRENLKKRYAA